MIQYKALRDLMSNSKTTHIQVKLYNNTLVNLNFDTTSLLESGQIYLLLDKNHCKSRPSLFSCP